MRRAVIGYPWEPALTNDLSVYPKWLDPKRLDPKMPYPKWIWWGYV
jgi:hypothetical protein